MDNTGIHPGFIAIPATTRWVLNVGSYKPFGMGS
jgi:hypothetical protein